MPPPGGQPPVVQAVGLQLAVHAQRVAADRGSSACTRRPVVLPSVSMGMPGTLFFCWAVPELLVLAVVHAVAGFLMVGAPAVGPRRSCLVAQVELVAVVARPRPCAGWVVLVRNVLQAQAHFDQVVSLRSAWARAWLAVLWPEEPTTSPGSQRLGLVGRGGACGFEGLRRPGQSWPGRWNRRSAGSSVSVA